MSGKGAGQGNQGRGRPEDRKGARRDSGQDPSPNRETEETSQWFTLGRFGRSFPIVAHRAQAGVNARSTYIMPLPLPSAAGHYPTKL